MNFNAETSSLKKGESLYDTVKTFESFGVNALVIRYGDNEYYNQLIGKINIPILNGGDGTGSHPTQSLLDLLTIRQEFGKFEGLRCVIIGDIKHSRVAHTNIGIMKRLGMEVYISGPESYREDICGFMDMDEAVRTADVIMLLRVQHERHLHEVEFIKEEYHKMYGMTIERANQMKPTSIIMHPAPFNRGVEIADDVVECDKARIFKQVENGVYVRMALLNMILG